MVHRLLAMASNLRSWPQQPHVDLKPKPLAFNLLFPGISGLITNLGRRVAPLSSQYAYP